MNEVQIAPKEYQAPVLVRHGSFADLTLGDATGTKLDATFPAGTPFSDLTFS
jgi:hypothetical protein